MITKTGGESYMNIHLFILFLNTILTTLLSVVIVFWILRKEYLPVIRRLEKEHTSGKEGDQEDK